MTGSPFGIGVVEWPHRQPGANPTGGNNGTRSGTPRPRYGRGQSAGRVGGSGSGSGSSGGRLAGRRSAGRTASFGEIRPTTTMVEVSRLIDPDMLVEIEAEAILSTG